MVRWALEAVREDMARKCIGFLRAPVGKMPHQRIFFIQCPTVEAVREGHGKEMYRVLKGS